jgi:pilus assembly protein CpaE
LGECQSGPIREFISYPPDLNDVSRMLGNNFDVILVDLDSDPEYALDLVESICTLGLATAIVYSAQADPDLLVRCMRAGAREYLMLPFDKGEMAEALVRASALRSAGSPLKKDKRQAACISQRQRRFRSHHAGLQFCGFAGPGIPAKNPV